MKLSPSIATACIKCGRRIDADASVCMQCGTDQRTGKPFSAVDEGPSRPRRGIWPRKLPPSDNSEFFAKEGMGKERRRLSLWIVLDWTSVTLLQAIGVVALYFTARGNNTWEGYFKTFALWYLIIAGALVLIDAVLNSDFDNFLINLLLPRTGLSILMNAENPYFLGMFFCAVGAGIGALTL
ncbi:MAG TPA: hypothetical protein VG797_07285 [Phycisphaerales bacterium]|nr:hypothetical protein [Phycisphaerales bacterium]